MSITRNRFRLAAAILVVAAGIAIGQTQPSTPPEVKIEAPDIPVPEIKTAFRPLPGVNELPDRPELPDVLTMNDGTKVTTKEQWQKRRAEMREILEYYATGHAPPPPGNVKGREVSSQLLAGGKVKYRLIHLTFGPEEKLFLDIGVYTPTTGGPFPAVIMPQFNSPPGAKPLPRLAADVKPPGHVGGIMTFLGTDPNPAATARAMAATRPSTAPTTEPTTNRARNAGGRPGGAEGVAASNQALNHGYAYVTFNYGDCGEDNRLRLPDGSWAYRTTRFFPAYPEYDWGLIRAWGWGASRVVDYLETDPSIDSSKLIISGTSRLGKSALFIGAFDDRFALVAPVASSGLGTPAARFSGEGRGGNEGLDKMMQYFPNQFGPKLYQFKGKVDKLPFDQHWFMAMVAPRPFIALEGVNDKNVNQNAVRQSINGAKPAYELLGVPDRIGVWWADRPHGINADDWEGMLGFADKFFYGKTVNLDFTRFPDPASPSTAPANP